MRPQSGKTDSLSQLHYGNTVPGNILSGQHLFVALTISESYGGPDDRPGATLGYFLRTFIRLASGLRSRKRLQR